MLGRALLLALLAVLSFAPAASALDSPNPGGLVAFARPCNEDVLVQVDCEKQECTFPYAPYVYWPECVEYECTVYLPFPAWCIQL